MHVDAPATVRPIVVIESDDWGRVGLPSLAAMEALKAAGVPIGMSPWDHYGLESEEDVIQLGDTLSDIRDSEGRPACFTANFVMANADLERMQQEDFREFRWISIDQGFPAPWRDELLPAYRRNVERGVFYPGLHGFTHFNASAMMALLRQPSERGALMRQLVRHGVPYLASVTPECNFALVERHGGDERFLPVCEQEKWIETGVNLFARAFGHPPLTTCAPGYRANPATFEIWARHGIEAVQTGGNEGISATEHAMVLARNLAFEPALDAALSMAAAIENAGRIVACGHPIVLCSHSINYVSRFLGRAGEGRRQLAGLLRELLAAFPDLRFAHDADIVAAWRAADPAWFRAPGKSEIAARRGKRAEWHAGQTQSPSDEENARPAGRAADQRIFLSATSPDGQAHSGGQVATRLGIASLYVLLGNIFTLAVGLPLQIYVARVLGPGGVGVFGILEAAAGTAAGLLGLGIGQTTMRFLPEHLERSDYDNARTLVGLGSVALLVVGGIAYFILLQALPWIGNAWPAVASLRNEVTAMGLMIPLALLTYFFQQALRGLHETRHIVLGSSVLQLGVKALLTVGAFIIGWRLEGYILASLLGAFCGLLWLFYHVASGIRMLPRGKTSSSALPQWYRYALITYSGALLGASVAGLDRFLVGAFVGSSAVGVLMVARQLQNLLDRFIQMLLTGGAPLLSAAHARADPAERQRIFCLMTDWSVRCALPAAALLVAFAHPILALYGPQFADQGAVPLRILAAAAFFGLLCGPVGNVALMSGLERQAVAISMASTGLMLVTLLALVPAFGIVGAAVALAAGILSNNLAMLMLDRWRLNLRWRDRRFMAWLPEAAAVLLLLLPASRFADSFGAADLGVLLAVTYAVAIIANLAYGLHNDDRDLLRSIWTRLRGFGGGRRLPV